MGFYDKEEILKRRGPERILQDYIKGGIIKPSDVVREMGCGNGRNVNYLIEQGFPDVLGIDKNLVTDMISLGKKMFGNDIPIERGDLTNTGWEDNSVDVILVYSVLHFFPLEGRVVPNSGLTTTLDVPIREFERLARPGARILGSDFSDYSMHPDLRKLIDRLGATTAEMIINEFDRRRYARIYVSEPMEYREQGIGKFFVHFAYRMKELD